MADSKPPIEAGYGPTGLMDNRLPTVKLLPSADDGQVSVFTGETATPVNLQMPAQNYARAFDPGGDLYSPNTGVATVRELDDLAAMFSTAPQTPTNPYAIYLLPASILIVGFLLLRSKI